MNILFSFVLGGWKLFHPISYLLASEEVVDNYTKPVCDEKKNDEQNLLNCITLKAIYLQTSQDSQDESYDSNDKK